MHHLMVVDDDQDIRSLLKDYLGSAGYQVSTAIGGAELRRKLRQTRIDLIILDLNLIKEDGLTLFKEVLEPTSVPVIMLTARSLPADRITGLETGADDYLSKPFEPAELLARIRTVLRRTESLPRSVSHPNAKKATFENWSFDLIARQLTDPTGRVILLTTVEFDLLKVLTLHAPKVIAREQLLYFADEYNLDRSTSTQIWSRWDATHQNRSQQRLCTVRQGIHRMNRLLSFVDSMAGRIFVLAAVGMPVSAAAAFLLAGATRDAYLEQIDIDNSVERIVDVVSLAGKTSSPKELIEIAGSMMPSIIVAPSDFNNAAVDPTMTRVLTKRLAHTVSGLSAKTVNPSACQPKIKEANSLRNLRCWLVSFELRGQSLRLLFSSPPYRQIEAGTPLIFFVIFSCGAMLIAYVAARMAAAPLYRLAQAAERLGRDINEPSLVEQGSTEVRQAARAFNRMQIELQLNLTRRTQMLAAITHDLQTPLTRLRLRLETLKDEDLRKRLVDDLAAMQSLINEGLELARLGHSNTESLVCLDVRSLLTCIVEDDYGMRQEVQLADCCDCSVTARPKTLRRCINNLVDNAIKHAGSAILRAERDGSFVRIETLDEGPGLPESQIDAVFEPFVRLDESRSRKTGGSGLGLTIARALAEQNGGTLALKNRSTGGLCATIVIPLASGHQPIQGDAKK